MGEVSVSIIIPTFNRLAFLKKAIASIECQTCQDFELIIVDDGSTDETPSYLKTLSHTIILLQRNKGVSFARNQGIKVARGRYIAFLDSDDIWCPMKLEVQLDFHNKNPSIGFSYSDEQWFRDNNRVKIPKKYQKPVSVQFEDLLKYTFIGPSSVMIKRSVLDEVGLFDESFAVCEDFDLWLRIACTSSMKLVPEVYFEKHTNAEQLSMAGYILDAFRIRALQKHNNPMAKIIAEKKIQRLSKSKIGYNSKNEEGISL